MLTYSWIVLPVVNQLEIASQFSNDRCSLDGDSRQTAECFLLNDAGWKMEVTYLLTHIEGREDFMVGFHPSLAQYWQEQNV